MFGGTARDTATHFVNGLEGGKNEFPVPVDGKGRDLYAEFLGRKMDYKKLSDQEEAQAAITENIDWFMDRMVFSIRLAEEFRESNYCGSLAACGFHVHSRKSCLRNAEDRVADTRLERRAHSRERRHRQAMQYR